MNAGIPISNISLYDKNTGRLLKDDMLTLGDYGIKSQDAYLHMVLKLRGGGDVCTICGTARPFRLNADELDPTYDFDFINLKDDGETYI